MPSAPGPARRAPRSPENEGIMAEYEGNSGVAPRIQCCCCQHNIYPWEQDYREPVYWRFYWNFSRGGFLRRSDGSWHELLPEYFYIIPGGRPFASHAEQPFHQFYIHFDPLIPPPAADLFQIPATEELRGRIREFAEWGDLPAYDTLRKFTAQAILNMALLALPHELFIPANRRDPRIAALCDRINRHPEELADNNALAARLRMNRNSFIRLFRRETGMSPQKYCRLRRLEKACDLLRAGDLSIDEIAADLGFVDRYHFTRVFHKMMGSGPARFRRMARQKIPTAARVIGGDRP